QRVVILFACVFRNEVAHRVHLRADRFGQFFRRILFEERQETLEHKILALDAGGALVLAWRSHRPQQNFGGCIKKRGAQNWRNSGWPVVYYAAAHGGSVVI